MPFYLIIFGILVYSTWIFELFLNPHLSLTQSYVSELAVHGQPNVHYFRIANLLGSTLMSMGFILLCRQLKKRDSNTLSIFLLSLCALSLFGIVNAIFPMDCSPSQSTACLVAQDHFKINFSQWVHQITAIIMFCGLIFVQLYSTFYIFKRTKLFWSSLSNFVIQLCLNTAISIICLFNLSYVGVFQRISLVLFALWLLTITYLLKARSDVFNSNPKCNINTFN
jgi:hypothetical protein